MEQNNNAPHVVIIGAGFAGLEATRVLANAPVRITMVDRNNYHLFQPLLYQLATAGLSPEDIARPVRAILKGQENFNFLMTEVTGIDKENKTLHTTIGNLTYDYLIVAAGSGNNFFGLKSVEENAMTLKTLADAIRLRNHVLLNFEAAQHETDVNKRRQMLTFTVVGGGPTGIEYAGALSELIYKVLPRDYPQLNFKEPRILLLEATENLLPFLPKSLREKTAASLWLKKIEVRFGASVESFNGESVHLQSGEIIPANTMLWAAGVRVAPLIDKFGLQQMSQGRIKVTETLQAPEFPEIFIVGDSAYFEQEGKPLPMMALVALQQASVAAKNIRRLIDRDPLKPFFYFDMGSMAIIGRNDAVGQVFGIKMSGFFAWAAWMVIHIIRLASFRNRVFVFWKWFWDYLFYDRFVRIISKD